jgi:hypothetical protein
MFPHRFTLAFPIALSGHREADPILDLSAAAMPYRRMAAHRDVLGRP